jgi:hypothetical protein
MKKDNVVILSLLLVGAVSIAGWHMLNDTRPGSGWYELRPDQSRNPLTDKTAATRIDDIKADESFTQAQKDARIDSVRFSWPRTIGLWIAAFFTLATFSFLYRDNPFYKIAEHAFVGVSAAYWMVVAFWTTVVPNLLGKLFPRWVKFTMVPGQDVDDIVAQLGAKSWFQGWLVDYEAANGDGLTASTLQLMNLPYWVPLVLGVMLLWRLMPSGTWIARWPLAFILGTTAGMRLTGFLESDFIKQIQSTIIPLYVPTYDRETGNLQMGLTFYHSMNNILIVLSVMCGLVYFFFSLEHKGFVGRTARLGIWVLMITFGAGFGYTVMGRIALLVGRFEFLVIDWLRVATE